MIVGAEVLPCAGIKRLLSLGHAPGEILMNVDVDRGIGEN